MVRLLSYAVFIVLGALAGWAYWYFHGCDAGCTITGQWWTSTAYGAVVGWAVRGSFVPGLAGGDTTGGKKARTARRWEEEPR